MKTLTVSLGIAVVALKMMSSCHHQHFYQAPHHLNLVSACEGGVRRLTKHRVVVSRLARNGLRQGKELISDPTQASEASVTG